MTKYPHLFGNPKDDLAKLCANIVKFRHEALIAAIEEGKNCDQEFMLACMGLFDTMITEIEKNPEVMEIAGLPTKDTENYFHYKFEHLVANITDASKKLYIKETEVALIVTFFEYFIDNKVNSKAKNVTIKNEFRREFLCWYRTEDNRLLRRKKSIRDHIKKTSDNFALDDYIFDFRIKHNKEIITNFFNRNDINKFNPKIPEVKTLFDLFYKYIFDLIK